MKKWCAIDRMFFAILMVVLSNTASASTIAIRFIGTVEDFNDRDAIIGGSLSAGEHVSGTLSFVGGKADQNALIPEGFYQYPTGELRIQVDTSLGTFDTGQNNVGGMIHTMNDHPQHGDYTEIHSYTNGGWQTANKYLTKIYFWMQDYLGTPDAIKSDAEPSNLVPSDWDLIYLRVMGNKEIYYPEFDYTDYQAYDFQVHIVSANVSSFSITPASKIFAASGGSQIVTIDTEGADCSWTASESLDWVSLSKVSGIGDDTLNITVDKNTGDARSGTVTIAGQPFSVSQDASSNPNTKTMIPIYLLLLSRQ